MSGIHINLGYFTLDVSGGNTYMQSDLFHLKMYKEENWHVAYTFWIEYNDIIILIVLPTFESVRVSIQDSNRYNIKI